MKLISNDDLRHVVRLNYHLVPISVSFSVTPKLQWDEGLEFAKKMNYTFKECTVCVSMHVYTYT